MIAADAMRRFRVLTRDQWIFRDIRLGGVPRNYPVTLAETNRVLRGWPCDRVEIAYLLSELVVADLLLAETVTRLAANPSRPVPADRVYVPTSVMIEAVAHFRHLSHDELGVAHDLAATWPESPAELAAEARRRHGG